MDSTEASNQEQERQRLRDQFAAAALTGIGANRIKDADDDDRRLICNAAYRLADAMLEARNQKPPPQ